METGAIQKFLEISITIAVLVMIYFQQRKDMQIQSEQYIKFTEQVRAEAKVREEMLTNQINKQQDALDKLVDKLDVVDEIKQDVRTIGQKVDNLERELK